MKTLWSLLVLVIAGSVLASAGFTGKCRKGEVFKKCGSACPPTCSSLGKKQACSTNCVKGCFCRGKFVRNDKGECVNVKQCPKSCGENESYNDCGTACPLTCDNSDYPPKSCTKQCVVGCECKRGFVRSADGMCVRPNQCPPKDPVCGENEGYNECGTACPLTCDNCDDPPKSCTKQCVIGCECLEGFVRRDDGRCVRPNQCPAKAPVCGENERYNECGTACPLTCDNCDDPPKTCTKQCVIGCECLEGFVRRDDGRCVRPNQCPPKDMCYEDEVYMRCGSACPPTCSSLGKNQMCTKQCVPGCFCKKGLVRNDEGYCVPPKECPKLCGENEIYNKCGTACPLTCDNCDDPPKSCTKQCVVGCECKKGFVRRADGRCVSPDQCPPKDLCDTDEVYLDCGSACPPTCSSLGKNQRCSMQCVPGCFCKKGLVRNDERDCVRPEQCPKRCGENERYNHCGTACPLTCDNCDDPPEFCTKQCVIGCECLTGFVRRADGRCVKPHQCPAKAPVCGENERFNKCGTACPLTCDNCDDPPEFCTAQCVMGCECLKGFVRRADGSCVKPHQCPAKAPVCGENEGYNECGTACPLTCDNCDDPPKTCTAQCVIGCECLKGFVRRADGRCVRPNQCPWGQATLCQPDCKKAPETGVCRARMSRYYYDLETGQCLQFVYGGCGGNKNNFKTEEECYKTCDCDLMR